MKLRNISTAMIFLGPAVVLTARGEVYMDEAKAMAAIFPGQVFANKSVELTLADIAQIEAASGVKVRSTKVKCWLAPSGDMVFIDQVLGKHEFITYAVGVRGKDTKVAGVEILEYRESYGQGVRKSEWNSQFIGKDKTSRLKVGEDVKNLGGATLSSSHITEGVRRLLKTYDIIHTRV